MDQNCRNGKNKSTTFFVMWVFIILHPKFEIK